MARGFRHHPRFLSFLLVVVAVVSQLALGAMVLPDDSPAGEIAALDAVALLCGHLPGHDGSPAHRHRTGHPALCPVSIALALPSAIPTSGPALPVSYDTALIIRTKDRPPARGLPARTARVGAQRAPPLTA